jgi:hypothetical protein
MEGDPENDDAHLRPNFQLPAQKARSDSTNNASMATMPANGGFGFSRAFLLATWIQFRCGVEPGPL